MAKFEAGMEAMLDMFVFETSDLLAKLDDILMRTEQEELTPDDIGEIFRIMHTVKGSAAMMGLQNMSHLAHALEDLFSLIREDPSIKYDKPALYEMLYAGSDSLKYETENISDESVPLSDFTDQIAQVRAFAEAMKNGGAAPEAQTTGRQQAAVGDVSLYAPDDPDDVFCFNVRYDESCMMPEIRAMVLLNQLAAVGEVLATLPPDLDADDAGEAITAGGLTIKVRTADPDSALAHLQAGINVSCVTPLMRETKAEAAAEEAPAPVPSAQGQLAEAAPAPAPTAAVPAKKHEDKSGGVISVRLEKLDRLVSLAQEIVIAQSGVLHNSELAPYRSSMPGFERSARELKKLIDELQDMVMSVRMVPVSGAFSKMNRVVRDMNKTLGKGVKLVFVGEETEVDKSVNDMLGDPLMHLVRNAVDHGIESPEERKAAGKTEEPTVTLSAFYDSNDVVITVADNGAGMDPKKLLEKGRQKGILTKPESEYTEQDCFALIMAAGFSTNTQVTEYSGRGVGMDVVKKNLEKIGGSLSVDSKLGLGSTFTIRVPMSLSVSTCMGVMVGGQEYAIPMTALREAFRPQKDQTVRTPEGREAVCRQGENKLFNVIRLGRHFGTEREELPLTEGIILLCNTSGDDDEHTVLFADALTEEMQIVIKPFSHYLARFGLKEKGLFGTSVLGDGSIIPVIDVNEVLRGGR
ncbi:MAG: chemotaxis protein CheA [Ruminococcus sp.]|nr:chemotaxis protein CheA [Ruminococcus sp.]